MLNVRKGCEALISPLQIKQLINQSYSLPSYLRTTFSHPQTSVFVPQQTINKIITVSWFFRLTLVTFDLNFA